MTYQIFAWRRPEIPGSPRSRWVREYDEETKKPVRVYKRLSAAKNFLDDLLIEPHDYACYRIVCSDNSYVIPWYRDAETGESKWLHIGEVTCPLETMLEGV